jgi:hypothetical protein
VDESVFDPEGISYDYDLLKLGKMDDKFLEKLVTAIKTHTPTPKIKGIETFKTSKTILSADIAVIEPANSQSKEAMLFIIEDIILIYYK